MAAPAVLILTHPQDAHADAVAVHLDARAVAYRHDIPELAGLPVSLHLRHGEDGRRSWGRIGDMDLATITCVWHRRPSDFIGDDAEELSAGVGGILATLPYLNHPADMARAALRPLQLVAAQAAGLDVPCTTITTSAADLETASHLARNVVVKPLSPRMSGFVREDDRSGWDRAIHLTQSRIHPDHHLRITFVDGQLFATRIDSPHLDWRTDPYVCRYSVVATVPGYYREPVVELMEALSLRYAALDFVVDGLGHWWFLKVDPNGGWLWLEQATGQPISTAVAHALTTPPE